MGSLAGLLKQKGYEVAGSDQEMYEPMKGMLEKLKIPVTTPYKASNLQKWFHMKPAKSLRIQAGRCLKPDIVVVGNAIGRGNPELERMLSNGHIYRSMSDILLDEFISGKKSIVITGTHGKTTITALVSWILECARLDPTVFIGGIDRNLNSSFKLGKGKYIVLEGDEYDTAFFDKSPKFWHYRPFIGVVNNIEYDHIDIFKNFDSYQYAFERFANLIPENGLLVANAEDKNVIDLVKKAKARFHVKTFGLKHGDYIASDIHINDDLMMFHMKHKHEKPILIKTDLIGKHNVLNILSAIAVARFVGVSYETIKNAIATFKSVKRRAEIIGEKRGIIVIDDYAHHPTAVRETLIGLKQKFHSRRLFLMFEPGSASSKRNVFEKQYIEAFRHADIAYIYKPYKANNLKSSEAFHGKHIVSILNRDGISAKYFENINKLVFRMKHDAKSGDVIIIMSCRGFDGLRERILNEL